MFLKNLAAALTVTVAIVLAVGAFVGLIILPSIVSDAFGLGWGIALVGAYILAIPVWIAWAMTKEEKGV